ncbi:MAG: DUF1080 domain-containing protein [Planctomycetia bacterium]|nr:DUF1080 domain-containing protein [Planctomycetia bacterium]
MFKTRTFRPAVLLVIGVVSLLAAVGSVAQAGDFVDLFNGESLDGWRAAENPGAFSVENGVIKVHGTRGHLFYEGEVQNHCWKNFHLQAVVMTKQNANSGIFIHTRYQDSGWPQIGYECQVANTHPDPQKTGTIYNHCRVNPAPAQDDVWFTYDIIVEGKRIITKIDGKVCADWTEPDDVPSDKTIRLSQGTFALQAHDPGSVVYFKSIKVKSLD